MANIQCASPGNKIRLKKKSPDGAMANASATIIGHQGTGMGPLLVHQTGGGKYSPQNMHPLQGTLVDQVCFSVFGPGLCTRIGLS